MLWNGYLRGIVFAAAALLTANAAKAADLIIAYLTGRRHRRRPTSSPKR